MSKELPFFLLQWTVLSLTTLLTMTLVRHHETHHEGKNNSCVSGKVLMFKITKGRKIKNC